MKIAQVVCRFKPYKAGIGNVAYSQSLGLAKLGHQVTVFTPSYNKSDQDISFSEFEVKRLRAYGKIGNGAFLPQLFWSLKKFDLVNLHYPFFGGAEVIWLLKLLRGKKMKLVISYHMDVVGGIFMKPFFKLHTKFIMPRIIKSADLVIADSLDYVKSSNIKNLAAKEPEKFVEIQPSVDLERFFPSQKDKLLLYKYGLNEQFDRVLLFVGALDKAHYFKGIEFLINSFNVLDYSGSQDAIYRVKLLIVGEGNLKEKYQNQVAAAGLQDKIIFTDPVSDADLPKYYNLAEVIILPSIDRSEAFGITLIEALACAKPVVASNLPGVRSVVDDGINGFVFEVKQEGDLANCVNKLFKDNELREKMGQVARAKAEKFYNQDILISKLEKIYLELVK
ncbi:MAG: glycosyltransferase family 4 protein [Candidatus Parcubacteria bacterium]|nr:glycosyltransferase family 4 protein [Candidatus Parcubacteria bacterium]